MNGRKVAIPLCQPEISGNEWLYVKECLDTGWVSSTGSFVNKFELKVARYCDAKYAVATINGTAALHIALLIAGVQPGDEVVVPSLTFIAPVNAIRYCGAYPVFIDSESNYYQLDVERLLDFFQTNCKYQNGLLINRRTSRQIKAILPVHILGHPVDLNPLLQAAENYGIKIIEDSTESLGAKYHGKMVGTFGETACLSFNGNKLITTGGGGMILTECEEAAERARYLTTQAKDDPVEFIHMEIGYNYRLSNVQAAIGLAQLEKIQEFIDKKRKIAAVYKEYFSPIPGITPMNEAEWAFSVFWMYTILVEEKLSGISSRKLLSILAEKGIQTRPLWQPVHQSPAYSSCGNFDCSRAEYLNRHCLCLPCSVGLTHEEQMQVIENISSSFRA